MGPSSSLASRAFGGALRSSSLLSSAAATSLRAAPRSASAPFSTSARLAGVQIVNIQDGDGKTFPKKGDTVTIHYVGTLADGSKFDSSRDRGQPFKTAIGVGRVIRGWDEGVPQLSVGQKAKLICTPDYAYGASGYPPVIPPNADLTFEVELLDTKSS